MTGCATGPADKAAQESAADRVLAAYDVPDLLAQAALAVTHRINWIQDRIEFITGVDTLPETVYQFSTVPSRIDPLQVLMVAAMALVLSLGATLLPSRQGANLDPVEGLRHE